MDLLLHVTVALIIVHRAGRAIDRNLREVRTAEPGELRVGVGKQTTREQRIVREIDARHDVARMKRDLFGLGEEVIGIAIEHQLPDRAHRHHFFGNDLGRIEQIEIEFMLVLFLDDLHAEFPFGHAAALDRFPQIAPMEIGIACR